MIKLSKQEQLVIARQKLRDICLDIEGRSLIVGFGEPKFKKSSKGLPFGDLDSKLNARFITYFLPAVEIARMQEKRPRLFIISGLNMALQWNAETEEQKKIMIANNSIKIDFLKNFFETFFEDDFALIEYIVAQDTLKIPEEKLMKLWKLIEDKYKDSLQEIRFQLTKFLYPKEFNVKTFEELSTEQLEKLHTTDSSIAFKYALGHLFSLGDINFEGNYIHNPKGYVSFGGDSEKYFNIIRRFANEILRDHGDVLFDRKVIQYNNRSIILENDYKVPPPYNGMFNKKDLLEVTYENERDLNFYTGQKKLVNQMEYMYKNILSRDKYKDFWIDYRSRYFNLKERYREAFDIKSNW